MTQPFIMFGPAHLFAAALGFALPLALAAFARGVPARDRAVRYGLTAFLVLGWICWYTLFGLRGWLTAGNALPLNLCDWAAVALIIALITRSQRAYELGYYWGLGGTLQGLITPDIAYGFPDPQFIFFFIQHSGVIACLLYLTLGTGLRPWPSSLPRVVFASLAYAGVAGAADYLLGVNYGFLAGKPANASLIAFLSPWPWYIPELVLIGLASALIYYTPFAAIDLVRLYRRQGRSNPSRTTSASAPPR